MSIFFLLACGDIFCHGHHLSKLRFLFTFSLSQALHSNWQQCDLHFMTLQILPIKFCIWAILKIHTNAKGQIWEVTKPCQTHWFGLITDKSRLPNTMGMNSEMWSKVGNVWSLHYCVRDEVITDSHQLRAEE